MQHVELFDEELMSQLTSLCVGGRRWVARVIVNLTEVEDRGIDKRAACSSMWDFCIHRLGMSEGETSRRLNAGAVHVRRLSGAALRGQDAPRAGSYDAARAWRSGRCLESARASW